MYFELCSLKNGCFDLHPFFTKCSLGPFSLSAVKLVLGLPWDSEILDRMYWQLGEMYK